MSMNEFLAEFYNTNGDATEKTAGEAVNEEQIALFAKVASANGIDVSSLSDEKLEELFHATFSEKTAGEEPTGEEKDDKDEETEKKAEEERLQKQAEEADYMGRIMAHAYVNEMRKIASDVAAKEQEVAKTASIRERLLSKLAEDEKKDEEKKDEKKDDKGDKPMPPWMKDKEASAFNQAAVELALDIVQDFNKQASAAGGQPVDVKVAAERLAAVYTLHAETGLSEKTASAQNLESAVGVRALEFLEAAGYPVQYPQ